MKLARNLILIYLTFPLWALAQQDVQFSQYMFSPLSYNPAYSGILNTEFTLIHRSQWLGYNPTNYSGKAPTSQYLGISVPVDILKGGVGVYAVNDQIGNLRNTYGKLSYARHLKIGANRLSIGVAGGLYSFFSGGTYIYNDANDPNINNSSFQQMKADLAVGVWYYNPNYYVGISSNHINSPKFSYNNALHTTVGTHYYVTAGYFYDISDNLKLNPSILLKSDNKPRNFSLDATSRLIINEKYWIGAAYRYQDAIVALLGISFLQNNALKLGYAFDYTVNGRSAKAATSHEIMLSYVIPPSLSISNPIIRTPRYRYN